MGINAQMLPKSVVEMRPGIMAAPPVRLRVAQAIAAARAAAVAIASFYALLCAAEGMLASALFAVRCENDCSGQGWRYTYDAWQWTAQFGVAAGGILATLCMVVFTAGDRRDAARSARKVGFTLWAGWLVWFFVAV